MTQAIYEWMKNLAIFYIFLTVVMNLMPDSRYGEYMRFFMGLLLILLILAPVLGVLDAGESVQVLFRQYTSVQEEREWEDLERRMRATEELQEKYQEKMYELSGGDASGAGEEGEDVTEDAQ